VVGGFRLDLAGFESSSGVDVAAEATKRQYRWCRGLLKGALCSASLLFAGSGSSSARAAAQSGRGRRGSGAAILRPYGLPGRLA
jgi:hypothetical protein